MPGTIEVNDKMLQLSPEFVYVHDRGDTVYAVDDQRSYKHTDERQVKQGDVIDSLNTVSVVSTGTARLLQFSHNEELPKSKKSKKD